ncbi:MAG TPA: DinB family protein [Actinomycetota bacterium]|nr:DinB family protein [Actinomycetota bacterium]
MSQLQAYIEDLEELWRCYDTVWSSFSAQDWSRKFGKDWTFADQPYHLAYFDRVILADALEAGGDLPQSARWAPRTMRELDAWNEREFARRPAGQTPQRSLEELREVRDRLRVVLSKFTDGDLDTYRAWNHLIGEWTTLRVFLEMAFTHNWSEYSELLLRSGRTEPAPPPATARTAIKFYLLFMASLGKPERVKESFTVGWDFVGPASAQWTLRVAGGSSSVTPGLPADADVSLRLTPDTFNTVMLRRARNPMLAMLRGDLKVKGFTKMGAMMKIFPEPGPDDVLDMPLPS